MGQPSIFRIFPMPAGGGALNDVPATALGTGFCNAFIHGATQAVAIRKGAAASEEALARDAFKLLDKTDVVVGPAVDGQFYLIGMRNANHGVLGELLKSIDLGSAHLLEEIMHQCQELKLSLWVMETQAGPAAARKAGSWA